ncbi:MAG: HD-GYP domain-containing protein [Tissierellales bacterium]|nr:HD-GYP domain-containing protein [Tissierellales bacterium]
MKLNLKTKVYLLVLSILAISLYIYIFNNYRIDNISMYIFWTFLAIAVESLLIPLPNNTVGVSVGYAINVATVIVGGPLLAATATSLGVLFRFPKIEGRGYVHLFNLPAHKTLFNVVQSILVSGIMGLAYLNTGGQISDFSLFPTLAIVAIGVLVNTFFISVFLGLSSGTSITNTWMGNIRGTFLNSIAVGTIGIIIALAFISYGYGAVILFFGPLLLARYSFKLYIDMRNLYISTIQALNKAVEAKDSYTSGHANRVEELAVGLAKASHLSFDSIENIRTAAVLHDIGKIGIKDEILNKAGKLTKEEYEIIMKHPTIGADIIGKVNFLSDVTKIVRHHHEKYDGTGYPDGLKGEEIPIEASILMIADTFDAMTTDRPYRKALTKEMAIEELKKYSGTQFDPKLVETFINMINQQV